MPAKCRVVRDPAANTRNWVAIKDVLSEETSPTVLTAMDKASRQGGRQKVVSWPADGDRLRLDEQAVLIIHGKKSDLVKACSITANDPFAIKAGASVDAVNLRCYSAMHTDKNLTLLIAGETYWAAKAKSSKSVTFLEYTEMADPDEVFLGADDRDDSGNHIVTIVRSLYEQAEAD